MIVKESGDKSILIAETENDFHTLRYLYDKSIVFGMYQLHSVKEDRAGIKGETIFLKKHFPSSPGLAWISLTEGNLSGKKS